MKDRLIGWNYKQLVAQAFGEPTFSEGSSDGRVQKEWVFIRTSDGEPFTIYDWKTYDETYAMTMNQNWNVGGKVYAGEFVTDMIAELKKKKLMSKYRMYSNSDSTKETISMIEALDENDQDARYVFKDKRVRPYFI